MYMKRIHVYKVFFSSLFLRFYKFQTANVSWWTTRENKREGEKKRNGIVLHQHHYPSKWPISGSFTRQQEKQPPHYDTHRSQGWLMSTVGMSSSVTVIYMSFLHSTFQVHWSTSFAHHKEMKVNFLSFNEMIIQVRCHRGTATCRSVHPFPFLLR